MPYPRTLNLVVGCSDRKSCSIPREVDLANIDSVPVSKRESEWTRRLLKQKNEVLVRDLYRGDHWSVARSIPEYAASIRLRCNLWVCSAGYGLLRDNDAIAPYSCTFSAGHPSSILRDVATRDYAQFSRDWWGALTRWRPNNLDHSRSLAHLAKANPRTPLIVALSPNYLRAIEWDLEGASKELRNSELLCIVAPNDGIASAFIDRQRIPCDSRFQHKVGGAMPSLSARLAKLLISNCRNGFPGLSELKKSFKAISDRLPNRRKYDRKKLDASDTIKFIRIKLKEDPSYSSTTMLRCYRDQGFACEQKKFGGMFRSVQKELQLES